MEGLRLARIHTRHQGRPLVKREVCIAVDPKSGDLLGGQVSPQPLRQGCGILAHISFQPSLKRLLQAARSAVTLGIQLIFSFSRILPATAPTGRNTENAVPPPFCKSPTPDRHPASVPLHQLRHHPQSKAGSSIWLGSEEGSKMRRIVARSIPLPESEIVTRIPSVF